MTNNLNNLKQRLEKKVNDAYEAGVRIAVNRNINKEKLKNKLVEQTEESILRSVPKVLEKKAIDINARGIFICKDSEGRLTLECNDIPYDEIVYFKDFDEIREFTEEIKKEVEIDLKSEVSEYKETGITVGMIKFSYEYKPKSK